MGFKQTLRKELASLTLKEMRSAMINGFYINFNEEGKFIDYSYGRGLNNCIATIINNYPATKKEVLEQIMQEYIYSLEIEIEKIDGEIKLLLEREDDYNLNYIEQLERKISEYKQKLEH